MATGITFSMEDMLKVASGDIPEELQNRIHEAEKYEKSAGLRAKVKTAASENAAKFITGKLAGIKIPESVKDITMIFDFGTESTHFNVRSSGVKHTLGNDVLAAPSADIMSVVSKADAAKESDTKSIIVGFLAKALGGQNIYDHVMISHTFQKFTLPELAKLYNAETGEALASGITEVPDGDKLKLTLQYSKIAADKPAEWTPVVSCGKNAGGGTSDGTRKKRTPAPDGYKSWQKFVEEDTDPATVKLRTELLAKHGAEWHKSISATNALRGARHPKMLAADSANPARM